jgi:hypothetical protein
MRAEFSVYRDAGEFVRDGSAAAMYTTGQQQEEWLKSATAWQKRPSNTSRRAGMDISIYLEKYLNVSQKSTPVVDAFMNVVDEELAEYCRPDKFEKGILYVHCLPGPCLHQLRMKETEIIEKIKTLCPKAKLRALRFIVKN